MSLITDVQLAEQFGITVPKLHELRKRHHWPHVRLGRFEIRFTDAQVEQIVAMHSEAPKKPDKPSVVVAGQTSRSASRARTG